jgi:hypothetical protein
MKKFFLKATSTLCVITLLFTLLPTAASGAGGASPLTVGGTDIRTFNYMYLENRGNAPPKFQDTGYNTHSFSVVLEGKKIATGVGSNDDAWDFTMYINYIEDIYSSPVPGYTRISNAKTQ